MHALSAHTSGRDTGSVEGEKDQSAQASSLQPVRGTPQPLLRSQGEGIGRGAHVCFSPAWLPSKKDKNTHFTSDVCEVPFTHPSFGPWSNRPGLSGSPGGQSFGLTSQSTWALARAGKQSQGSSPAPDASLCPALCGGRCYLLSSPWTPLVLFIAWKFIKN